MTNHTDTGSTCTRVQAQGYGAVGNQLGRLMERVRGRVFFSLSSWLLPSSYISTSLDLLRVPTVSNVVHRMPSPADSHDCAYVRSSTWTRIHPPTSSLYISPFMFTASDIRHPFVRSPHLTLNVNVRLVASTRTRR